MSANNEDPDRETPTARSPTMSEDSRTAKDPSVTDEVEEQDEVLEEKVPVREFNAVSTGFGEEEVDMIEVMAARKAKAEASNEKKSSKSGKKKKRSSSSKSSSKK